MSNMSHIYSDRYDRVSGGDGSNNSSSDSAYHSSRLHSAYVSHDSVSLPLLDEEEESRNPPPISAPSPSQPDGFDDLYQRRRPSWLGGGSSSTTTTSNSGIGSRHRHHSSNSNGPLLGNSSTADARGRSGDGGIAPKGRRWDSRRATVGILSFCSLLLLAWLSLTTSGSDRLASASLQLGPAWRKWGLGQSVDEAKWKGWEFARDSSIVFTWVNGSDVEQQALRAQYGSEKQVGGARDRDNDDLRYSMRSVAAHLPWHRGTVFIVSPTLPTWLNVSHPRIRWIDQNSIVPKEYLPVFSSNAIEPFLHLIPGVTERFIVFNDDFMVRRRMEPWDFFTRSGAVKLFLEPGHVDVNRRVPVEKKAKQAWLFSVHYTIEILYARYHFQWPNPQHRPRFVKHAPFVYVRHALADLHTHFGAQLASNARRRFRNPEDVLVPFLHHGYLTQEGARCCGYTYDIVPVSVAQKQFFFLSWTNNLSANALALEKMERVGPQVAAFNDNMGKQGVAGAEEAKRQMHRHFVDFFGDYPAEFERATSTL
ncbi:hypothetical protein A4X03_0g2739 [Tilletia caries]|uniref:Stealth protein CR2 conserved region 2 domain-containing protein n=1 Tax=Tilletia caries TaxID=13290 RepID=A0A8T8TJL4_9BASI|nr:hypothetical protein A4X03_0g2739 [Tilletia caries]